MAYRTSLPESTAAEFLNVLNSIRCPYTQDVDESYISEVLFKPGEHRIRLLLWIFGEIDVGIENIVKSEDVIIKQESDLGVDKRIQLLTSLGASFGICRPAELDLVRGNSSFAKQRSFWKKLLGIVKDSKKPYLNAALADDAHIMDQMLMPDQSLMQQLSQNKVQILPTNLEKEVSILQPNQKFKLQAFRSVEKEIEKFSEMLKVQQSRLEELGKNSSYLTDDDEITKSNVSCKLDLTLGDIDQMVTAYEQVFSNNYLPYCNKQMEEFGKLGPLIQIVTKQLHLLSNTFDCLTTINSSSDLIVRCGNSWEQSSAKQSRFVSVLDNFLSQSIPCLEKLENSVSFIQGSGPHGNSANDQLAEHSAYASKLHDSILDISSVM